MSPTTARRPFSSNNPKLLINRKVSSPSSAPSPLSSVSKIAPSKTRPSFKSLPKFSFCYAVAPLIIAVLIGNISGYKETDAFEQRAQKNQQQQQGYESNSVVVAANDESPEESEYGNGMAPTTPGSAIRLARNIHELGSGAGDSVQHVTISPTAEPRLIRVRPPAEQRLYSYLFDSPSAYLKHVRPVIDHATSVKVRLGVCIMTVDDIVEKDQTMLSTGCVKMKWIDEVLRWDPALFDNLTWIVIPSTEIWLPDVALVNSPDPFHMTKKISNVELSYTGEVGYYPSGRFSTRCPVTLTYFPFDAQLCELQFESWAYPVQQLELVTWPVEPVDMKSFVTNHQWLLDGVGVQPLQTFYDGFNFSTVRFHFFFHRRSLYYTVYAVYPCLLMAALQLFSHTLPVEHPGRMALLTSLFIGSSVVQSSITSNMPKSSDGISVIQVYLMLYSGSLLLSIIVTAVNMHIFYRTPDDSAPGVVPLFTSFLLTFGIRPVQKQSSSLSAIAKIMIAAHTSSNDGGGYLPTSETESSAIAAYATAKAGSRSVTGGGNGFGGVGIRSSAASDGPRNRKNKSDASRCSDASSTLVVGMENETENGPSGNNKSMSSPRDEFELIVNKSAVTTPAGGVNTKKRADGGRGESDEIYNNVEDRAEASSPTALDLMEEQHEGADEGDNFIDAELESDYNNSYYLLSGCTTTVRPVYEYLPFVSPPLLNQASLLSPEKRTKAKLRIKVTPPPPPPTNGKAVVRSNTTPPASVKPSTSVSTSPTAGASSAAARNRRSRTSAFANFFSRSPRKKRLSSSMISSNNGSSRNSNSSNSSVRLSTFHSSREIAHDWKDDSRRWSVAPPPTIFTASHSPSSKMGASVIEEDEEYSDSSDEDKDQQYQSRTSDNIKFKMEGAAGDDGHSKEQQANAALSKLLSPTDSYFASSGNERKSSTTANIARRTTTTTEEMAAAYSGGVRSIVDEDLRRRTTKSSTTSSRQERAERERAEQAEQANRVRIRHAWLTYAAVIDKFFFYAMGVINFFTPAILFLVLPAFQGFPGDAKMNLHSYPTPN